MWLVLVQWTKSYQNIRISNLESIWLSNFGWGLNLSGSLNIRWLKCNWLSTSVCIQYMQDNIKRDANQRTTYNWRNYGVYWNTVSFYVRRTSDLTADWRTIFLRKICEPAKRDREKLFKERRLLEASLAPEKTSQVQDRHLFIEAKKRQSWIVYFDYSICKICTILKRFLFNLEGWTVSFRLVRPSPRSVK